MRFRRTGVNAPATIKIRATSQHHAKNFGKHLPRELNQIKTCAKQMKFLAVHPSCLMYSKIYLRLEPLGLELVAAAARGAGHSVRLIDLQCEPHQNFFRLVKRWQPDVIAFCVNYLANVPEVIDLARSARGLLPETFICVGGHSVSFIPEEILRHAGGAVDCVLTGEGETAITGLLDALGENPPNLNNVSGCVTLDHRGPPPAFVKSLDDLLPARVLLRNKEICQQWKRLGLNTMYLGPEAIDEDGLKRYRKRVTLSKNFEALEFARSLDISVAVNIIADPAWDRERFKVVRDWCLEIPEVVNISINTPYPGTETWRTESRRLTTRDYRLFDIQHAVLPTKLPLPEFYKELVDTQRVLSHKHLGWAALRDCARIVARQLLRGQTNFIRMLWKFDSVYHPELQLADHRQPVKYEINLPPPSVSTVQRDA